MSMRKITTVLFAAMVCVAFSNGAVFAQLTDTTWTANHDSRTWNDALNWNNGVPNSAFNAIIPAVPEGNANKFPRLNNSESRAAGKVTIQVSANGRGKIEVLDNATLTLGNGTQTSMINGDIILGDGNGAGTLKIEGAHTIQGEGGTIHLENSDSAIKENNGSDSLVLQSSTSCDPTDPPSCTMLLHGEGDVQIQLDNRAYVVADKTHLILSTAAKTGSSVGHWVAEITGTLEVDTTVTGACSWALVDTEYGGTILVDAGCVAGTGPVTIYKGILDVRAGTHFCTTGNLTWQSVSSGGSWSRPRIKTTSTSSAFFGGTCTSCP